MGKAFRQPGNSLGCPWVHLCCDRRMTGEYSPLPIRSRWQGMAPSEEKTPVQLQAIKVQYGVGIYDRFDNRVLVNSSTCKTIIYRFYSAVNVTKIAYICSGNKIQG